MSRIGKKLIEIPEGVDVKISESEILTKGPKGELSCENFAGTNAVSYTHLTLPTIYSV